MKNFNIKTGAFKRLRQNNSLFGAQIYDLTLNHCPCIAPFFTKMTSVDYGLHKKSKLRENVADFTTFDKIIACFTANGHRQLDKVCLISYHQSQQLSKLDIQKVSVPNASNFQKNTIRFTFFELSVMLTELINSYNQQPSKQCHTSCPSSRQLLCFLQ